MKQKVTKARKARTRWTKFEFSPMHHTSVWFRRSYYNHYGADCMSFDARHGMIGGERAAASIPSVR